jgi:hypothetical protein
VTVLKLMASKAARKFQVALGTAAATWATLWILDGDMTRDDILATVLAFLGALGVFAAPNKPAQS